MIVGEPAQLQPWIAEWMLAESASIGLSTGDEEVGFTGASGKFIANYCKKANSYQLLSEHPREGEFAMLVGDRIRRACRVVGL